MGICGVAVLVFFYCGDAVNKISASTKPGPDHGRNHGPDHGLDHGPDQGKKFKIQNSILKIRNLFC